MNAFGGVGALRFSFAKVTITCHCQVEAEPDLLPAHQNRNPRRSNLSV